jgi:hypothetical protein
MAIHPLDRVHVRATHTGAAAAPPPLQQLPTAEQNPYEAIDRRAELALELAPLSPHQRQALVELRADLREASDRWRETGDADPVEILQLLIRLEAAIQGPPPSSDGSVLERILRRIP